MSNYVALEEANSKLRTKEQLYEGLKALDYFLPTLKSSMATGQFLEDVRYQRTFCMKYDMLRLKPLARNVTTKDLK